MLSQERVASQHNLPDAEAEAARGVPGKWNDRHARAADPNLLVRVNEPESLRQANPHPRERGGVGRRLTYDTPVGSRDQTIDRELTRQELGRPDVIRVAVCDHNVSRPTSNLSDRVAQLLRIRTRIDDEERACRPFEDEVAVLPPGSAGSDRDDVVISNGLVMDLGHGPHGCCGAGTPMIQVGDRLPGVGTLAVLISQS